MQGDGIEFIDILDKEISYFIRCEHLARYIYASEQLRKRKAHLAMDIACGSGYGSYELAKYAEKVISIDKDPPYDRYQKSNIKFLQSDLNRDNFISLLNLEKKLDAIVCFETLEHLDKPEGFLSSLAEIIKNNGLLFISVPNGEYEKTDDDNKIINPFHLHKFKEDETAKLLEKSGFIIKRKLYQPTSAQLYRNEARALRDLKLNKKFAQKKWPDIDAIHYYSRIYAWPDQNKGQSYSLIFMCERRC